MANFCSNCGKKLERNSKFCSHCGKKIQGLKSHPSTITKPAEVYEGQYSAWKVFLFSVLTFGVYQAYWGYRLWWQLKETEKSAYSPAVRGFFVTLSSIALFPKVFERSGRSKTAAYFLAIPFLAINFIGNMYAYSYEGTDWQTSLFAVLVGLVVTSLFAAIVQDEANDAVSKGYMVDASPRRNWALIAVLTICLLFFAAWGVLEGLTYKSNTGIPFSTWQRVPLPGNKYAIKMPSKPEVTSSTEVSNSGIPYSIFTYTSNRNPYFTASYLKYAQPVEQKYDDVIQKVADHEEGTMLSKTVTTFAGMPALQFTMLANDFSVSNHYVHGIIFGRENEIYVLQMDTSSESPPEYKQFLDSFSG